ncbi:hypothetical protein BD289DRAFT_377318 [Coniella lustricola]|uniref:Glycosyl hydrolase n=1 Tax=Coniella lustricola TaxID=2025994 RepID=A0A2T2ZVP0_9PEZI|nr:hypothetical protein BD289DRAFT_377318 [Coniella lustricola]
MYLVDELIGVLSTMQSDYFQPWLGTWPTAIDWTAAVMGTHVSAALSTISRALDLVPVADDQCADMSRENTVTLFFSQLLGFYFGQDSFAIRNEAYDDILWVVLGWLETIRFVDLHAGVMSRKSLGNSGQGEEVKSASSLPGQQQFSEKWHGIIWNPAFAHRSRIFWNLAKTGWDSDLCGGGMVWNPTLEPYKNAITNQLFISASTAMHVYFPGDDNQSPFSTQANTSAPPGTQDVFQPRDPAFLKFAKDGYNWLQSSGMKNKQGLYIDGFHISGWSDPHNQNKKCDLRNEQVYTYNQGVILTGLLDLWRITGNHTYAQQGHRLVDSVVRATGWHTKGQHPIDLDISFRVGAEQQDSWRGNKLPRWHGIGRAGVLEEFCDSRGECSQDAQTFKGIFFHHLATFCSSSLALSDFSEDARRHIRDLHQDLEIHLRTCVGYEPWLNHNRRAMLRTRDGAGHVGTWWTAGVLGLVDRLPQDEDFADMVNIPNAVDYRNEGVPKNDPVWTRPVSPVKSPSIPNVPLPDVEHKGKIEEEEEEEEESSPSSWDLNDRGRGRTVETQGSGLALLRAHWEAHQLSERWSKGRLVVSESAN